MTRANLRKMLHAVSKQVAVKARAQIEKEVGEYVKLHPGGRTETSVEPHLRGEVRNVNFMLGMFMAGNQTRFNGIHFNTKRARAGELELYEARLPSPGRRTYSSDHELALIFRVPLADPECVAKSAHAIAKMVGRKVKSL